MAFVCVCVWGGGKRVLKGVIISKLLHWKFGFH